MGSYSFENLSILIVDDNKHMHSIIEAVLGSFGCNMIHQETNPDVAFARLREYKPDIIFSDLVMRPTDGIEFVRRIRNDEKCDNPFVPIIMVTGHASKERVNAARNAGINELLVKPVTANAIMSRVDAVIRKPRPFIRAKEYFGPDRRRVAKPNYKGDERRDLGIFEVDDTPQMA